VNFGIIGLVILFIQKYGIFCFILSTCEQFLDLFSVVIEAYLTMNDVAAVDRLDYTHGCAALCPRRKCIKRLEKGIEIL
jgi:hypothetical protein